jgi:hypothetical protein
MGPWAKSQKLIMEVAEYEGVSQLRLSACATAIASISARTRSTSSRPIWWISWALRSAPVCWAIRNA